MKPTYAEFVGRWSALHGNVSTHGIVGGWLKISYRAARVSSALRITPHIFTLIGVLTAGATAMTAPRWWSALFLLISLFCDGIGGSVAIFQNRTSRVAAILDAVADRISEAFWAIAFYRLGVPLAWVLSFAALAAFQEYARARLASAGIHVVGVVTPAERPVRASFLFIAILALQFTFTNAWVTPIAVVLTLLQAFSFLLLLRFASKQLR